MPLSHRPVPVLPECPRPRAIAHELHRSYSAGQKEFTRAFAQSEFTLSVSASDLPAELQATLVTTLNGNSGGDWINVPYTRKDSQTLECRISPAAPGLYTFRTRFSIDSGSTWLRDPVPDAWVLVDPPQVDQMRQYTLIPTVSGTLSDWGDLLPKIKDLGFNTVHLLPITTLDQSQSPYAASDLFSVDPSYLAEGAGDGMTQLLAFVERAKTLEMRLCFDLVLNHVGSSSLIVQRAPEWIMPDETSPDGLRRARYWSDQGWLPWNDLVLIDYEHPVERIRSDIWHYMTEYALFWSKLADYTNGFVRFDNLHSSDKGFVTYLTKAMRSTFPNLGIIAEYFTDAGTLLTTVPGWGLNLILATPWDSRFVPQLRDYLKYIHSMSQQIRFFMPITSHDSGSPAQEFASADATIPRYVAAALLGTGATGITQGVEWGVERKIEFIGRKPRLTMPKELRYGLFIKRVNEIVSQYPAFRRGGNCQFVDHNHHALIAAFRKAVVAKSRGFLVICNFDILSPHRFEVDLSEQLGAPVGPVTGIDLLTEREYTFPDARIAVQLPVCAALVLMF